MSFARQDFIPPITKELFDVIRVCVPKGSTILELGSGEGSTQHLKEFYTIYSVEHNVNFIGKYNIPENYIYAPLVDDFYDRAIITTKLPKYDALLIDGPDTESRNARFLDYITLFDRSVHWFFDDYNETNLGRGIDNIASFLQVEPIIFKQGCKHFAVILGTGK